MERKCADVLKEALILYTREINDLMHDAEQWKQRFETQQTHKEKLQEECKTLENKSISLQTTIDSLKEQISDLKQSHRESSGLGCRMCDHLQRMNDSLTEAYSNNLREKDRRISDLENQLFEYAKNSSEKAWNLSNKTPHKPRSQGKDYLDGSLRSESPDSTSRSTPNKSGTHRGEGPRGDHSTARYSSNEKDKTGTVSPREDKESKLRLRSRKRNRYTEDPSPENKRPKYQPKVVLVPETCDPDIVTEGEGAGGEEECPHREGRVPDTEPGTRTSDSESDAGQHETMSRYSLRSSLFSPSSEESDTVLKSPKRDRNEEKKSEKNCQKEAKVAPNPSENGTKTDLRVPLVDGGDGYIQSSPIFQVYKKSNLESPDVNRLDTGAESEAESPLLLKVSKNLEDKAKESSPAHTRLFEDDCVGVSPTAVNGSYSKFRSLSQGRQRRKLSKSRLSGSEERKKRPDAGENWLNSTKTAVKDSPTLRQSTLSQVFMNIPTKPQAEKSPTTESDDIQKAIELSLRDQRGGKGEQTAEKENLPPFKRPLTPRKCKKSYVASPKGKRRNRITSSVDCDPDETVPPLGHETAEMSQDPGALLNGSIDPVVQLSVLCDSQSLKSDDLPDLEPPVIGDRTESLNTQSQIGDLADFRIADLRKSSNPLTSTCIDVENPPHPEEEDSQSIPCSIKFGDGRRKMIRIPENLPEDPDSERLIPAHEDSFDRVPGKKQPDFAHVDVVRKQDERRRLPAHKCEECREYYEGMGLSEEEIQQRIQTCSRHRAKHAAPGTPEHFWDIGMEDTLECEERGYINTKDPDEGKPRFRRKRQLNKMFKSKKEEEEQEVL